MTKYVLGRGKDTAILWNGKRKTVKKGAYAMYEVEYAPVGLMHNGLCLHQITSQFAQFTALAFHQVDMREEILVPHAVNHID